MGGWWRGGGVDGSDRGGRGGGVSDKQKSIIELKKKRQSLAGQLIKAWLTLFRVDLT